MSVNFNEHVLGIGPNGELPPFVAAQLDLPPQAEVAAMQATLDDYQAGQDATDTAFADSTRRLVGGESVVKHGATGDGVTDDTPAFAAAVTAASGAKVIVPPGRYVVDHLAVTGVADIALDPDATLVLHAPSSTNRMIDFTGTYLRITGGTVDGQRGTQTGWPSVVFGTVESGKAVIFDSVHFTGLSRAALLAQEFGGYIQITNCRFTDQAEHSGTNGQYSTILDVTSGQAGAKGLIRFNHNRATYTGTPAVAGANPGGIFVNTQKAGIKDGDGNLSTIEAIGNYFYGYGQNAFGNDISPIHTYPTPGQMRVIGNYFEKCGFCAISAKSAQDAVIVGNTIVDGVYSSANIATEGAISYAPGYHSQSFSRPRAVIANNIVTNPGGQSTSAKQYGISVIGSSASIADNVVVQGNVLSGCGYGISVRHARDVSILGNMIDGATGGASGTENGIRLQNTISGTVTLAENKVTAYNGTAFLASDATATDATMILAGNSFRSTTGAAVHVRGVKVLKMTGNVLDAATTALYVGADSVPNNVGTLAYDATNTILAGAVTIQWSQITRATGQLFGSGSPKGVVTPGEAGTTWRRTDGREESMWIARTATAAGWTPMLDRGTGTPIATPGAAAGTGATVTVTGTDTAGTIELSPGTGGTTGGLISVQLSQARSTVPQAVILTPGSTAAAAAAANVVVHTSSMTVSAFAVSATTSALGAGLHRWHYLVV